MKKHAREFTVDPKKGIILEVSNKVKFEGKGIVDR